MVPIVIAVGQHADDGVMMAKPSGAAGDYSSRKSGIEKGEI